MRIQQQPLTCKKCKHEWHGEMVVDAAMEVWQASMKAIIKAGCPSCGDRGKSTILMGHLSKENPDA